MSTGGSNNPCSPATEGSEQTGNEPAMEHEEGPSTSKKAKFFHVDSSRIKSVPLSEQAAELKDLGLFSVYDQQELEQGIIQQVDNAIHVEEEKQAKKHAEKELKMVLNEIRSTKEELNHVDKLMRNIVLPSGHSFGNKDSHRQLVSIKSQKEVKKKQLKKLHSRHQCLLARLGGTQDGLQEDLLQDEGETQAGEGFNILRNLLTDGQSKPEDKETEEERMIRLGEMTPFGTTLKQVSRQPVAPPPLTDFEKYMMEQAELASKKKSLHGKKKGIKRKEKTNRKYIEKKLKEECNQKSEDSSYQDKLGINSFIEDKRQMSPVNSEDEFLYMEERCHSKTLERKNNISNWQSDSEVSGIQSSGDEYHPEADDWKSSDNETYSGNKYNTIKPRKKKSSVSHTQLINMKKTKKKNRPKEKPEKSTRLKRKTQDDGNKEMFYKRLRKSKKARLREKQIKIENGEVDSDSGDEEDVEFDGGWRLPQRVWKKLYRYQQTGVKWLWELHQQECGGIIGDEMGLGKTIQIIAFLAGLKHSKLYNKSISYNGLGPVLIICPTTVMHQWLKEFHTWWPHFRVAILHDSGSFQGSKAGLVQDMIQSQGVLVTSYSGARINKDILLKYKWHYVILDEGHMIRNPNAEVTVVCKQFRTCHRLILSGSPVQNNLKELWSLIDFVFPGKLGTLPDFMQQFSIPITMGGYANATAVQVQTAYKCACVLRDTINPYLLRRMKDDVKKSMQLPPKNEQVLFCRLTNEQRSTYEEYLKSKECQMILNREYQVFAGLITLRKICNHPDLSTGGPRVPDGEDEDSNPRLQFGYWKRSGKMIVIESLLKIWKEQNHKVLLFSQSKQMLDILEYFVKNKYKYMRMDGSMGISSRQPAINKFNTDPSIFLFLLTTRVGGIGVNLTGANRIVIFDPDWNPSTDTQARERAWRIGQNRHVTIYRLLTTGTIEEKIYHRQIFKQFLTNRVLKDPKQRRFFKSNDLFELFTLGTDDNIHGTETNALFAGTGANIESTAKETNIQPQPVKRESVLNRSFKKYKPQSTTSKYQHSNANIPLTTAESSVVRKTTEEIKTNKSQVSLKQLPSSAENITLKISNPNNVESVDINIENGSDKVKKSLKNDNPESKDLQHDQEPSNSTGDEQIAQNDEQSSFRKSCNKQEDKESNYQKDNQMSESVPSNKHEEKEPIKSNAASCFSTPSDKQEEKDQICENDKQSSACVHSNQPEETKTTQEKDEQSLSKVSYNKPEDITEWKAREMKKIEKLKKKLLKLQNESKKEKMLKKKKKNKRKKAKDACLEGKQIAYLSRHSIYEQSNSKADPAKQDDYVLQKLFKKNGVQSAMKHDVIIESSNPDYLLVEKEAERVAKEAAIALKRSRRRCMPASSGIPTWTGSVGSSGLIDKPRFGLKKNNKVAEVNFTTLPAKKEESKRKFGSKKLFNGSMSGHTSTKTSGISSALPSSSELLSTMRARNDITDDASIGIGQATEKSALLQDLHAFISFQANVDGQATTDEILQRFKERIPREDSVVFRSLLHEICDSTKMPDGQTVWRLRQSFR